MMVVYPINNHTLYIHSFIHPSIFDCLSFYLVFILIRWLFYYCDVIIMIIVPHFHSYLLPISFVLSYSITIISIIIAYLLLLLLLLSIR